MCKDTFRTIPSVHKLLESPEISQLLDIYPRHLIVDTIREILENIRQLLTKKANTSQYTHEQVTTVNSTIPSFPKGEPGEINKRESEEINEKGQREVCEEEECKEKDLIQSQIPELTPKKLSQLVRQIIYRKLSGIEHAINATGVILHTGLGRAPLADEAKTLVQNAAKGFCTLEIEKFSGKRGSRYHSIERLICMITGAESALVVNNNAAAVLLALDTMARGKEVIISRSQLVEIGGSFRMPDVMSKGGVTLVEVGTTNKTYPGDYRDAITDRTGLILKVHQSNFKIVGFTDTVSLKDLVSLGQMYNIPVMYDLGSGALIDFGKFGLPHEPTVQESVRAGVDVVMFSTDKLLGGPQGGLIAGKKKWIDLLKKNPLTRALRVGKLTIAALEATLKLYLEEHLAFKRIPVLRMILMPLEAVEERCRRLIHKVSPETKASFDISVVDGISEMGGGALPGEGILSRLVSLIPKKISVEELAAQLRSYTPPIFARIENNHVLLDMRTLYDDAEIDIIVTALEKISSSFEL